MKSIEMTGFIRYKHKKLFELCSHPENGFKPWELDPKFCYVLSMHRKHVDATHFKYIKSAVGIWPSH